MNPRLYLELIKKDIQHAHKKLIVDQIVEHGIEHVDHEQSDHLLELAVETGPIGFAAEIGSIFTWGRVATVLGGISSSVNGATAGLVYSWTWSQIPSVLYGGFYDSHSFRDEDPQPASRILIRQKTIPESHSSFEFTKIYDAQKSNDSSRNQVGYNSYQSVIELIKNNERVEQRARQSEQVEGHLKKSFEFYYENKFQKALIEANKAIKLKHSDNALNALAHAFCGLNNVPLGNIEQALLDFDRAFALDSTLDDYRSYRTKVLNSLINPEDHFQTLTTLNNVLKIEPNNKFVKSIRDETLQKQSELDAKKLLSFMIWINFKKR